jgi:hypothetical protein
MPLRPPRLAGERPQISALCSLPRLALEIDAAIPGVASAPATPTSGILHKRDRPLVTAFDGDVANEAPVTREPRVSSTSLRCLSAFVQLDLTLTLPAH